MITNDQITAIAREYAEEIRKDVLPFFPRPLPDSMDVLVKTDQEKVERVIRFLLRRFCLVEKSVIKETWKEITNVYLAHQHITYDGARYLFDEVLFPEIAKEVES